MDAFTVGFQANETDSQTASADTEFGFGCVICCGRRFNSWFSTVEFEDTSLSDQEVDAIGVSWTMKQCQ